MRYQTPLLLTALSVSLVGCANLPNGGNLSGVLSRSATVNGYHFTPASETDFNTGYYQGLPRPRSLADLHDLDYAIAQCNKGMKAAQQHADLETFAILQTLGNKLLGWRASIAIKSAQAYQQAKTNNGNVSLEPNGYLLLPTMTDENQSPARLAAAPYSRGSLLASVPSLADHGRVNLAANTVDLTNLRNIIGNGLRQAMNDAVKKQTAALQQGMSISQVNASMKNTLRTGVPYYATDANGQSFIVERDGDGLILHNPGKSPVKVNLEKLGYVPKLAPASVVQQNAAPILSQFEESSNQLLSRLRATVRAAVIHVEFQTPNRLLGSNGQVAYTDSKGLLTSSPAPGRSAYQQSSAYRFAANTQAAIDNGEGYRTFASQCLQSTSNGTSRLYYHGLFAQEVEYACQQNGKLVYSKSYFINPKDPAHPLQTWQSVLMDKRTQDEVGTAMAISDAAEAIVSNIPVFGNIDAAATCLSSNNQTGIQNALNMINPHPEAVSRFVGDAPTLSTIEMGLACGSTVPLFGDAARAVNFMRNIGNKGEKVNLMAKWLKLSPEATNKAIDLADAFDSKLLSTFNRKEISGLEQSITSPAAALLVKHLYDSAQRGFNLKGIGQAVGEFNENGWTF